MSQSDIADCIDALSQLPPEERVKGLKIILKLLDKIVQHPLEEKYRKINVVKLLKRLNNNRKWIVLLVNCGFVLSPNNARLLFDHTKMKQLYHTKNLLSSHHWEDSLNTTKQSVISKKNNDSKILTNTSNLNEDTQQQQTENDSKDLQMPEEEATLNQQLQQHTEKRYSNKLQSKVEIFKKSFTIFETISMNCLTQNQEKIVPNCNYLQRILVGLKYFNVLIKDSDIKSSKAGKDIFVQFCCDTYTNYIDDFVHFMKEHGTNDSLITIAKELKSMYGFAPCDVSQCNKLKRHYRKIDEYKNEFDHVDDKFNYFCRFFDKVHHNIFHLFELGLRINLTESDEEQTAMEESFDKRFLETRDLIRFKQKKYEVGLDRFTEDNNKYNLAINYEQVNEDKEVLDENTCFDSILTVISDSDAHILSEYMMLHEYDSDALQYDLNDKSQSNICNDILNTKPVVLNVIKDHIRSIELSGNSFATGFRFYYWEWYQKLDQMLTAEYDMHFQYSLNQGYSIQDLLISPHYQSLKQEILSSAFISINAWQEKIVFKAYEHYVSNTVKSIKAMYDFDEHKIKMGEQIRLEHIICIILYCDWSNLQNDFSCTFRKQYAFEPMEFVKQRNSKYFCFSKRLIEAVIDFGIDGYGEWNSRGKWISFLKNARTEPQSPFYTGLSVVLNIPTFAIPLSGPCSTTKNKEIAINFAKRNGMIMQLINDEHGNRRQNYFDCSWISNYSEENERLFIFTEQRMKIQSIIIIETSKNFQDFFHAFYMFDRIISNDGDRWAAIKVSKRDILILKKLINRKMKNIKSLLLDIKHDENIQDDFDQYIIDTFDLFLSRKIEIQLSFHHIYTNFKKLIGLFFSRDDPQSYVLNTAIIPIFSNLETIVIHTTYNNDYHFIASSNVDEVGREHIIYPFSLTSFLTSIQKYPWIEYIIRAEKNDLKEETWITRAIDEDESIYEKFEEKNWDMEIYFVEGDERLEDRVDLIIQNMS